MSHVAKDRWAGGEFYEIFMGRWSRLLARSFVDWLAMPPGCHWLEIGCGTGSLTAQVCERASPASVVAIDSSPQLVNHARLSLRNKPVQLLVAAAQDLPTRRDGFDAVVSSLVLNFLPDPSAAAVGMRKVAADDGVVAACVWDYADGMGFLRRFWDAAVALDPAAGRHDEGARFALCSPAELEAVFQGAGFPSVRTGSLEIVTHFRDFDDYWRPFNGGPGPAPTYLSSLSEGQQRALAGRLRDTLPRQADGSILLTARAWAVRAENA